jgi:membrane-associated phospholipid phosphatase
MRNFKDPTLVWAAWAVSWVAWKGWLAWLTIAGAWLRGRRHFAVQLGLAMLVCTIGGLSLKGIIARPRPDLYASQQLNIPMAELLTTQHSFPSGHTLLASAFAFVVFSHCRDWRGWLAMTFAVAVAFARVYEGMHWPSDDIGSMLMGFAAGAIAGQLCKLSFIRQFATDTFGKKEAPAKLAGANELVGSSK